MPAGKTKTRPRAKPKPKPKRSPPPPKSPPGEVLTLAEAAAYLRVSEEAVLHSIGPEGLPGRLIDGEWRFLKCAVNEWLKVTPKPSSKEALLSTAGARKDDPFLSEMLEEIYRQRGRPMIGEDQ